VSSSRRLALETLAGRPVQRLPYGEPVVEVCVMAKEKIRSRSESSNPKPSSSTGRHYSAGEIFMAVMGFAVLILVVGIVVSEFLE